MGVLRVVRLVALVRTVQQWIGPLALQEGEALDQLRDRLQAEQSEAMNKLASEGSGSAGTTNLGALLKAKLNEQKQ